VRPAARLSERSESRKRDAGEMAVEARTAPAIRLERRGLSRRVQDRVATYSLTTPALALLLVFFLVPIYFIVRFSLGLERFAQNEAAAELTGELADFSTQLWADFLGPGVELEVLGSASVHLPAWVLGVFFILFVLGAVFGKRLSQRYGGWIQAGSFVLLLAPFMTIPAGNNLLRLAELGSEGSFLRLFFRSVTMATTSSVWAVIVAFPIAYFLAFGIRKSKYTWLLIVIAPFLTSYLLRVFAWKVILGDQGLINSTLFELGARDPDNPLTFLIYSQFTVILVLLYAWVPFIILPIFIALENIDRRLIEAATDLGASRLHALRKVTLPIAAPGIVAAFLFVFIPSMGEYITPSLVGGNNGFMFGQAIANQFVGGALDWQVGSVLSIFLLGVVLFLTLTTSRFLRQGGGATA
jgi:spermidine/putrescine transport system permease protein